MKQISLDVALKEALALVDFYRNRTLVLAQEVADMREQLTTAQTAALERASAESEGKE